MSDYKDEFDREAEEVTRQVQEWDELPWLRRHGPSIVCVVALVGTLLLLGLGIR